jgi:catechol 2,3-dioxygenase-like lactoylglutathione lyase family enzyme
MEQARPGAAYWIDHYVVPVSDLARWNSFYTSVLGARPSGRPGEDRAPVQFTFLGPCHAGGAAQPNGMPPSNGRGVGLPRYSYFIRGEEIEGHLRRLDQYQVPHSGAIRTSDQGEDGTAIRFEDPDGNQLELWAPARIPLGAMDAETPCKVGKIAAALFESRDLARSADFYTRYCGMDVLTNADVPADTLVLKLAAGGRVVFKQVDDLGRRTGGYTHPLHTALVLREDETMPVYERMWAELPEWDHDPEVRQHIPAEEAQQLPARTGIHGSPSGQPWRTGFGRGDSFWDWDTNAFHWVSGEPADAAMSSYSFVKPGKFMEDHMPKRLRPGE